MKTPMRTLRLSMVFLSLSLIAARCEYRSQPYFDALADRVNSGNPPDVGYMDALRAPEYIRNGQLKPLDDLVDKEDVDDFYAPLLAHFQRDGHLYALPRDFQTVALLINADLFAAAGLQPPTTWDELRDTAAKLTTEQTHGLGLTADLWNWLPFLFQAGGSLLDESGTKMALDTLAAQDALKFYASLHQDGYAFLPDDVQSWPYPGLREIRDAFVQGQVAMMLGANDLYVQLKKQGVNVQAVELPAGPAGKATIGYVVGYSLFSEAGGQPGPAVELLRFSTSREGMELWAESLQPTPQSGSSIYMPTRSSMREDWVKTHADAAAFMVGVDYLRSYQPAATSFKAIEDFDRRAVSIITAAMRSEMSIEDALAQLQEIGTGILQQ